MSNTRTNNPTATTSYPARVEAYLDIFEHWLQESGFYQPGGPGLDTDSQTVRVEFGKLIFEKWLQANDAELHPTEDEFIQTTRRCIAVNAINSLVQKGLVDTIVDENGEELVFLTTKGKEFRAADL